jgi:hypothetical protein
VERRVCFSRNSSTGAGCPVEITWNLGQRCDLNKIMGAVKSSVSVQFKVSHHSPAIANPASCVAIRFCCDVVKTHVMMLSWKIRKRVMMLFAFANMYQHVPMTSNDQSKHHHHFTLQYEQGCTDLHSTSTIHAL